MARKAVTFDSFSEACPYSYMHGEGFINNGYNCNHPNQENTEDDGETGESVGCCFCCSCPLGTEAETDDLSGGPDAVDGWKDIDWDGCCSDGEVEEGEILLVNTEDSAGEDVKRALFAYEVNINRYNREWLLEHKDKLRQYGYTGWI